MQEDEKRKSRDLRLSQIRKTIEQLFQENAPEQLRIVGDSTTASLDSDDYLQSSLPLLTKVQDKVGLCRPGAETRFLAVRIFSRHSFFATDANNVQYDYETAHEVTTPIPVYVLRLSKHVTILRKSAYDQKLASVLAEMHWGHGKDPLPLIDDWTKPVVYHSPRGLFS